MKVIACKTPYGQGGMGAHFSQIVEEARVMGELQTYFSTGIHPDDELVGEKISQELQDAIVKFAFRYATGLKHFVSAEFFDASVARKLSSRADCYAGFAGQFARAAGKARKLGFDELELHSPTAHVAYLQQQYADAVRRWPIEESWLHDRMVAKQQAEYLKADRIYVNSEYTKQTFIDNGIDEEKLVRTFLQTNPRFKPSEKPRKEETFRVVYTGSITVTKGIPLLLEAFSRLPVADAQLVLIGGWATRGMRQYMEEWLDREPRLKVVAGDPLPYLHESDCYVHPSYQDGYGYAPMEAMMCGIPVIVTEDTGMKENVREGENGYIVPTGSWESILETLQLVYSKR